MKKLDIIYEDKEIIVLNKPSGILTVSDGKTINTLYHSVREYLHKKNKNNKVFIVHRLDKDTSGVILFAKSEKLKHYFQNNWSLLCKKREYIAIVEGTLKEKSKTLTYYLKEDNNFNVYISNDNNGKLAITDYQVIASNNKYSYLRIFIKTGRKNQIRASLSYIGNPIVGDKKYNAKSNPLNRLGLHASTLSILIDGQIREFKAKNPKSFDLLFK